MKSDISTLIHQALSTLNLPPMVSYEEIKHRYHELSKIHHPDINKEKSTMSDINEAYAILKQYIFNYRFSFSEQEITKQFPEESHADRFRF